MRLLPLSMILALGACHAAPDAAADTSNGGTEAGAQPPETPLRPASSPPEAAKGDWRRVGAALHFIDAGSGSVVMMLACGNDLLRVGLPGVRPIASEERLAFGGGGNVRVLVARPASGAIQGVGPAPGAARLVSVLEAGPGASYGATAIGPLVPVPPDLARPFASSCD